MDLFMPSPVAVEISEQVRAFVATLHPEHRRAIKKALKDLAAGKGDIAPLEEELTGFHRLRVGRYRVVFFYAGDGTIRCFFIEQRRLVYDLLRQRPDLWPPER